MKLKELHEKDFIRNKLISNENSLAERYMEMTVGKVSFVRLLVYELITCTFGLIPGALGYLLRKIFYPRLFGSVGKGIVFGRNIIIRYPHQIKLGNNVIIDDNVILDGRGAKKTCLKIGSNTIIGRGSVIQSKVGAINIGKNCNIGTGSIITSQGGIRIGDWVQIAGGCKISGGLFRLISNNKDTNSFPFQRYTKGPIIIEDMCFIGGSTHVTDGVTIGKKSMIGAGSVVMSNIPENSIFMAKPGMVIGTNE